MLIGAYLTRIPTTIVITRAHKDVWNDFVSTGLEKHLLALGVGHYGHVDLGNKLKTSSSWQPWALLFCPSLLSKIVVVREIPS